MRYTSSSTMLLTGLSVALASMSPAQSSYRFLIPGHSAKPTACMSRDGNYIVSGSDDHTLKLWSRSTGELVQTVSSAAYSYAGLSSSPTDNTVAAGQFGTVQFYSVPGLQVIGAAHLGNNWAGLSSFSSDGQRLAVACGDQIYTVRVSDATVLGSFFAWGARRLQFALGTQRIIASSWNTHETTVFSASGAILATIPNPVGSEEPFAVSPDGSRVAIVTGGSVITVFDVQSMAVVKQVLFFVKQRPYAYDTLSSLAWSSDGHYLLGNGKGSFWVWDTSTWGLLKRVPGADQATGLRFGPSSTAIFVGGVNKVNEISVPDLALGRTYGRLYGTIARIRYSADSTRLAVGGYDGPVALIDAVAGTVIKPHMGSGSVGLFKWTADGSSLLVTSFSGLNWFSKVDGSLQRSLNLPLSLQPWDVEESNDGSTVFVSRFNGQIESWDVKSGTLNWISNIGVSQPYLALSSTTGALVVMTFSKLNVLDSTTGALLHSQTSIYGPMRSFTIQPDGLTAFLGYGYGNVQKVRLPSCLVMGTMSTGMNVSNVSATADGSRIAVVTNWDGLLKVFDWATGATLKQYTDEMNFSLAVTFSPDGQEIAVGRGDATMLTVPAP